MIGTDPLFAQGINWEVIVIVVVKVLVAFVVLLIATAMMVWFERKVISDMQSRIGRASCRERVLRLV